ncbi:hypothetical protein DPMN_151190 [Dreissena polymorpha]|uniref:Uncharacterized protein n=1 Tax=Dreissena polymorpha TaxID=45954 RepID=A0A9D4FJ20_DREPO|nr:hypothetical protein DPMN_151190 [Dreissena polymorpha]
MRLEIGPCIVGIDRIVISDVQYQFKVNRCRNKEVNFQGSIAYSVGGDSGQDGLTDGQTDGQTSEITTLLLKRINATPPAENVIQQTRTIFELIQQIKVNCLTLWRPYFQPIRPIFTLCHKDRTIKVASRVLTTKNTRTIFKIIQDIMRTNIVTKLNKDWIINMTFRVLTRKCPVPLRPCFSTRTIFKLDKDIIGTNLLTKFHEDRPLNVAYNPRVFTMKNAPPPEKNLTIFHEGFTTAIYINIKNNALSPCGHCFPATRTYFFNSSNWTHLLTRFHDGQTVNLASRVLPRKQIPPPGDYFHEDRTINVDSRVLTKQMLTADKR